MSLVSDYCRRCSLIETRFSVNLSFGDGCSATGVESYDTIRYPQKKGVDIIVKDQAFVGIKQDTSPELNTQEELEAASDAAKGGALAIEVCLTS